MQHQHITESIIAAAYKVFNTLGPGFLEKVYENAMTIELRKQGHYVESQHATSVFYDDSIVGEYYADLFVDDKIVVELKAVENLSLKHEAQLVNYLTGTHKDIGLLINFGSSVMVKRKYRQYVKK